jgi:fructose-bisphosphate aldolase, class I
MSRFIAAMDHSGGSTGGVLERYGQAFTEEDKMEKVHAMRLRMVNSPDFNDKNIWAAILYQDTVQRGMVPLLKAKGIQSFLKIDSGCEDNGYLKYFKLDKMTDYANKHECYGTKMRSIVKSLDVMDMILEQQFALAESIYNVGLMPIIEPEVPIEHTDKAYLEATLLTKLTDKLSTLDGKCILKLTPPEVPNLYHPLTINPNVVKVVFLSGGYSTNEACNRLGLNDDVGASFSRALSERLHYDLTDANFNAIMSSNIKMITEASA